jgi:hypothetical protein
VFQLCFNLNRLNKIPDIVRKALRAANQGSYALSYSLDPRLTDECKYAKLNFHNN